MNEHSPLRQEATPHIDRPIDVLVAGHLCLDLIPDIAHVPLQALSSPGKLFEANMLTIATGGAVANTGLALHKLGVRTRLMATVGADAVGVLIQQVVKSYDPALTEYLTVNPDLQSSYTIVLSPEHVDRIFLHATGANAQFDSTSIDYNIARQAQIVHLGYPPILPRLYADEGHELVTIMRHLRQMGCTTSLDMSLPDINSSAGRAPWSIILERVLPYVHIFIPSIDEILYMLRRDDFIAWGGHCEGHVTLDYLSHLADEIIQLGCTIVGFKLSEYGLFLKANPDGGAWLTDALAKVRSRWIGQQTYHPAYKVDVAGTTGAGDSTYAALLSAILREQSMQDAAQFACAVGASNVERADAVSGVQSIEQTMIRMQSGWVLSDKHVL